MDTTTADSDDPTDEIAQRLADLPDDWELAHAENPATHEDCDGLYMLKTPAPGSDYEELRVFIDPAPTEHWRTGKTVIPGEVTVLFQLFSPTPHPVEYGDTHTVAKDTVKGTGDGHEATWEALTTATQSVERIISELTS